MYLKVTKGFDSGITTEDIRQCERIISREVVPGQPQKPRYFEGEAGLHVMVFSGGDLCEELNLYKEPGLTLNLWLMNDRGQTIEHYSYDWK